MVVVPANTGKGPFEVFTLQMHFALKAITLFDLDK